jgi:hypothetical protein
MPLHRNGFVISLLKVGGISTFYDLIVSFRNAL